MRRRRRQHTEDAHENHERWLISFADYMTLLFALFVVLYAFAQNEKGQAEVMVESLIESLREEGMISATQGSLLFEGGIGTTGSLSTTDSTALSIGDVSHVETTTESALSRLDDALAQANKEGALASVPTYKVHDEWQLTPSSNHTSLQALEQLQLALQSEIDAGEVVAEQLGQQLVIRIQAPLAFPKDSQFLQPRFRPLVDKISAAIEDIPGMITVTGHTNITPPTSELYRDNWELSALRAVSVANRILQNKDIDPDRLQVIGAGASARLTDSDSAINDRVEVTIEQGKPTYRSFAKS
ncbi:flagellar motor protein MotB [Enterovibrio coralii]|uniref:OmpA-like domain-containing protein n=1 Tax=Enterovibrio coralii TaxID=294935 RepID=A0A135IAZ0_9GAMM|nr:flagellar motor protein MotB [Enterovibrio coralii]KXF82643.1 hypothetical protein ATN88_21540 [Enterovibrio coralii]